MSYATGVFGMSSSELANTGISGEADNVANVWFSAASCNNIYGNSEHVIPKSLQLTYYIRY